MAEKGVIWGKTAAKQIAKTVREVARRTVNESPQRGRWQQKQCGTSGGTHEVWAVIDDVTCDPETDTVAFVLATPIWYTNSCDPNQIPDIDSYGMIMVEAVCSDLFTEFYTSEQLLGKTLRATYMKPLTPGYCTPAWLLDGICGQPECA